MSIQTLVEKINATGNPTVVGLDARLEYLPDYLSADIRREGRISLEGAAQALRRFNYDLIDALHDIVPAIKPQSAYYELLGPAGIQTLASTISYAQAKGMYVIADIKRGDIGATASAYAEAYLGYTQVWGETLPVFGCDAVTVNPYLGTDGVEPFLKECRAHQKSIFVLVKTSNPSSGEFQNRDLEGQPLYARVAEKIAEWGQGLDTACGYNQVGAVVGATYPQEQKIVRRLLPHAHFLAPGYGAQGATAQDIAGAFNDDGLGAIVNSSRAIMCAWKKTGKDGLDYQEAARAEAIRMRDDIVAAIR